MTSPNTIAVEESSEHAPDDAGPLSGYRVLDLSHVIAGPYCGWLLATLGAEVIKVERIDGGDILRSIVPGDAALPEGMGPGYLSVNAGKKSIAVDLKSDDGKVVICTLAARSDIVLESFRAGAMDDAGIGHEVLMKANPGLIYCAISGFGQDGRGRGIRAFDHVIQAASGVMAATGDPDGKPMKCGFPVSDSGAGMAATTGIMAALVKRERTGKGSFVDVSMMEAIWSLMSTQLVTSLYSGEAPQRMGNAAFTQSPTSDCFTTGAGDLLIGANTEEQFQKLAEAVERPDLITDVRFEDRGGRTKNKGVLRAEIERSLAANSADAWEQIIGAAGVPVSVIRTIPEAIKFSHAEEDGLVREYDVRNPEQQTLTSVKLPGTPFKLDGERLFAEGAPPALGADTWQIMRDAGFSDEAINSLVENGAVAGSPPLNKL